MSVLDEYKTGFKELGFTVFPSEIKTIEVQDDPIYGGAHLYRIKQMSGIADNKTAYDGAMVYLQFIQRDDDGTFTPGLQSEQVAFVLLDRAQKLNERFPSPQNEKMVAGLQMFLDACRERVEDRISRGVMGQLKK